MCFHISDSHELTLKLIWKEPVFCNLEAKYGLINGQLIISAPKKKNHLFSIYKTPRTTQCCITWIFSFADRSREIVLIRQDGIFTGERKYAQTKCKYLNIAPKWSMHGGKQFGRSENAFQLSIILLLVFLQIVNQILFACLSALVPAS